ncbi:MAG: META domain-containing protein [Prevotellaceae bacterium]|jgi:hypothetical protein|nr:META domain-containing protein [Prevotellaceae bacterium]
MKKIKNFFFSIFTGIILFSCNITPQPNSSQNLENTMWQTVRVENTETGENLIYPPENEPYIVVFRGSHTVDFPYHCNVAQGSYTVGENGNITFYSFSPMTEMYCGGLSDWEDLVVQNFTMNWTNQPAKYIVQSDELKIICDTITFIFKKFVQNNILANTEWQIDGYKFLGKDENTAEYSLHLTNEENTWGTYVRFLPDGKFVSFDQQPCGNSCFTTVYGRYSLPQNDQLILFVDSVNIDCTGAAGENTTEIRNGAELSFKILNYSGTGFRLQKIGSALPAANLLGTWKQKDICAMDYIDFIDASNGKFVNLHFANRHEQLFTYRIFNDSIVIKFAEDNRETKHKLTFLGEDELSIGSFTVIPENQDVFYVRRQITTTTQNDTVLLRHNTLYYDTENDFILEKLFVENDSRCPIGVNCIWAGDADVRIKMIVSGNFAHNLLLKTTTNPAVIIPAELFAPSYEVKIANLLPYPVFSETILQKDYAAKILVRKIL